MVRYLPQRDSTRRPDRRRSIQRADLHLPHQARSQAEYNKLVYGKDGTRGRHQVVPRSWLWQRGRYQRSSDPGLRPRAPGGLEEHLHGSFANGMMRWPSRAKGRQKGRPACGRCCTASTMARDLAARYRAKCLESGRRSGADETRRQELLQMAEPTWSRVPWEPAETFWQAVQSLWLTHMLVMSEENYPGPGVSFGRIDQYLYPSVGKGRWRRHGSRVWQRDPQVLLDPCQHRLRCHDPHRGQPGHHGRLWSAHHPLRHGCRTAWT